MLTAILRKGRPATDKMMSVQVYIFRFHFHIQHPKGLAVKALVIRVNDPGDQGSDPDGIKILIFQISIPLRFWDVLGYIATHLGWYFIAHMV